MHIFSVTLRYLLPTIHGSLLVQALSFDISGLGILVSVFWGSILSPGSPFLAFPHLQFWRMGVYGFWGGLCLPPFGDPSHCYWFPTFQFCHFGHLVSQSIFSPLASFVPRAHPNQAAFWCWDYLIKTIHVQGP